jgi:hypothetical protein
VEIVQMYVYHHPASWPNWAFAVFVMYVLCNNTQYMKQRMQKENANNNKIPAVSSVIEGKSRLVPQYDF